ncbi:MAG TPA: hypothetical protein VEV84_15985 [Pyrinomonadaceae bacterium]|nr:hypothetical protein [Pyrinomonadaceae bacterium]
MSSDLKQYDIEMEPRDGYLHVIVGGVRVTPEVALDYWHEIIEECERIGYSKILLEHNFVEMISMPEMLTIIGPVTDLLQVRLLAFYDRQGHYDIPEAGKKIMRSHDVKMQIFDNVDEATRWLLAN